MFNFSSLAMSALALGLSITISGCATSIDNMDQARLRTLSNLQICSAVVRARMTGMGSEFVEIEKDRRRIDCQAKIEETVSDCSKLKIIDPNPPSKYVPGPNGENGYLTTIKIQNTSNTPVDFKLKWKGRSVGFYKIYAERMQNFSFMSGDLPAQDSRGRPVPSGAELKYCTVMKGRAG